METSYSWLRAVNSFNSNYLVIILVLVGLAGNLLVFAVFAFTPLHRVSSSVYFKAMSVTNAVFLVFLGLRWMEDAEIHLPFLNKANLCRIMEFVSYVASFLSIWLIVALTAGLYTSIFHKGIHKKLKKTRGPVAVSVMLAVLACPFYAAFSLFHSHNITIDKTSTLCPLPGSVYIVVAISILDILLTLVVPFSLLLFMNIRILLALSMLCEEMKTKKSDKCAMAPEQLRNRGAHSDSGYQASDPINGQCRDKMSNGHVQHSVGTNRLSGNDTNKDSEENEADDDEDDKNNDDDDNRDVEERINTNLLTTASPTGDVVITIKQDSENSVRINYTFNSDGNQPKNSSSQNRIVGNDSSLPTTNDGTPHPMIPLKRRCLKIITSTLTVLLVLNIPVHFIKFHILIQQLSSPDSEHSDLANQLYQLFKAVHYLNFIFNVLAYAACAKTFQRALFQRPQRIISRLLSCPQRCHRKSSVMKSLPQLRIIQRKGFGSREHSHLVDICLSDLRLSQIRSFGSDFLLVSPPCLLQLDSSTAGDRGRCSISLPPVATHGIT